MQEDLVGRPLTDEERQDVVEGYIEEEVLMHEAYRMDLIVCSRRTLSSKMAIAVTVTLRGVD